LAGVLSVVSWGTVSTAINRSVILRAMQHDLPAPPSVEGKLQSVLSAAHLPSLYASVTDPSFADSVRATLGATTVASGPDGVVKVIASSGCAFTVEGTGFVTGPDEVVTDAHLIAGQHDITVNGLGATVALFDPLQDLAVLRVAGLTDAPLLVASSQPTVSARVSVVGFQTASDVKTSAPGAYEGTVTAPSRSIYSGGLFLRRFALVAANVTVGNSGSPVLYRGTVVGVVIAKSSVTAHVAFAEPAVALARDLSKVSATSRASTQSCLN